MPGGLVSPDTCPVLVAASIRVSVVIVIAYRATQKIAFECGNAGFGRDIFEFAFTITPIERRRRSNQQNIQIAIAIVVQKGATISNRPENSQRPLARRRPAIIQTRFLRDITKN